MPRRQTTTESPGEAAAATEFASFERLPDELKLMIWKEAMPLATIQHIRVTLSCDATTNRQQDMGRRQFRSTIVAKGSEVNKSTWWHRHNIEMVNYLTHELVSTRFRRSEICRSWALGTIDANEDDSDSRRERRAPWVRVDADHDVVCVHFSGPNPMGFQQGFLSQDHIMSALGGLHKLALDLSNLAGAGLSRQARQNFVNPLACGCGPRFRHTKKAFCPRVLSRWLGRQTHLETLYVIHKLATLKDVDSAHVEAHTAAMDPESGPRGRLHLTRDILEPILQSFKGKQGYNNACKSAVSELTLTLPIADCARLEQLESFEDAQTRYYEVREQDSHVLAIHAEIWSLLRETEEWTAGQAVRPQVLRFKLLVGRDPRASAFKEPRATGVRPSKR